MLYQIFALSLMLTFTTTSALSWPYERGKYFNHEASIKFMQDLDAEFPKLVRIYSIGKSANGLELVVMELSAPPKDNKHAPPKRNVLLIGSIYGDEPTGRDLLLNLAYFLVTSYKKDSEQTPQMLDLLKIHILPTMNPDGSEVSRAGKCIDGVGRRNINGINLEGDFPIVNLTSTRQPELETKAVMKWMNDVPAVLTLNFRAGSYVVAYPYETRRNPEDTSPNLAPDDDVLQSLAHKYADLHPLINNSTVCGGRNYQEGIINGAAYRKGKAGGIQDYTYSKAGAMHLNIGYECCRYPSFTELPRIWKLNKSSLLTLLAAATGGLDGIVRDAATNHVVSGARLSIAGRSSIAFHSAKMTGIFSRILLPGEYHLEVEKDGYESLSSPVFISKERIVHLAGQVFSTQIGYTEVLLHPVRSTIEQPRRFNRHYNNENETISSTTLKVIKDELTTPMTMLPIKDITHQQSRRSNSSSTGHRFSSHSLFSVVIAISTIIFIV